MVAELASAIRDGRPPLTDGHAGLRVLTVLEAASASLEVSRHPAPALEAVR